MAATNIFYRIPSQRGTRVATLAGSDCTLHQFCNYIIDSEGLNRNYFIVASGTKVFRSTSCSLQSISLQNNSHVDIIIPLLGGKGGFGSLLRAIGAQIEKTTNRDACRDLSGRRLRDVKREEELKKLFALKDKLEEEKKRRRKEKLEKLKRKCEASTTSTSIQELVAMFDDYAYNKRRLEIGEILEAAVDKGIINFKKRQQEASALEEKSKKLRLENDSEPVENDSSLNEDKLVIKSMPNLNIEKEERASLSSTTENESKTKRNNLWLGLEDEDDEDEDQDDEYKGEKVIVTV